MESYDLTPAKGRAPGFGFICKALLGRVGRRQARSVAVSYLLDAAELPGMDWTNSREANFRSVRMPFRRSPNLKSVSASRNYRQGPRYLYIEIAVTENTSDADRLIELSRSRFYRKPGVTIVAEREMTGYDLPAVTNSQLFERETVRGSVRAVHRHITGRVGDVVLAVYPGPSGGGWDWGEAVGIATAQAEKINMLRSPNA